MDLNLKAIRMSEIGSRSVHHLLTNSKINPTVEMMTYLFLKSDNNNTGALIKTKSAKGLTSDKFKMKCLRKCHSFKTRPLKILQDS